MSATQSGITNARFGMIVQWTHCCAVAGANVTMFRRRSSLSTRTIVTHPAPAVSTATVRAKSARESVTPRNMLPTAPALVNTRTAAIERGTLGLGACSCVAGIRRGGREKMDMNAKSQPASANMIKPSAVENCAEGIAGECPNGETPATTYP